MAKNPNEIFALRGGFRLLYCLFKFQTGHCRYHFPGLIGESDKKIMHSPKDLLDLPVIASLLPATFTIPELQKLYEAILGRLIDRGNFRQKILRTKILEKVGERNTALTRRPPGLYRFNWNRYEAVLDKEVKIGF